MGEEIKKILKINLSNIKSNINKAKPTILKILVIFFIFIILLKFSAPGINWLWKEGKTNTMVGIICENYFCSYNFSGKIWEYENLAGKLQYFDTKQECKNYCIKDAKELVKLDETEKIFLDPPEYKKTWYYKIEIFFNLNESDNK